MYTSIEQQTYEPPLTNQVQATKQNMHIGQTITPHVSCSVQPNSQPFTSAEQVESHETELQAYFKNFSGNTFQ